MTVEMMLNPSKYGLTQCGHCNGYGSSLKERGATCSQCGGSGLVKCATPTSHTEAINAASQPQPQFPVGSSVCHRSFTDCFGKHHDAVPGLTVIESRLINTESIAAYYRIKAVGENGRGYVEAAERFFDADQPRPYVMKEGDKEMVVS